MNSVATKGNRPTTCPACGSAGRKVSATTVGALLRDPPAEAEGFRFCKRSDCDVVYFSENQRYGTSDLRVPVFQKSQARDRLVCYCFSHTVAAIEDEVAKTGASTAPEQITGKCRAGLDRCEEENPQGACCLGNVHRVVKDAIAARASSANIESDASGAPTRAIGEVAECAADCCAATTAAAAGSESSAPAEKQTVERPTRNTGLWSALGAVFAAVLSSACCWLPIVLVGAGASVAGVAGFFETYRLVFLGATGVLLVGGFYLVYLRKDTCLAGPAGPGKCAPREACARPSPRLRRFNRAMLWIATVFVVAFAAFPNYVGLLFAGGQKEQQTARAAALVSRTFAISGMTCEGCTAHVRGAIGKLSGVRGVDVSYARGHARVQFKPGKEPDDAAVIAAVAKLGYRATRVDPSTAALDTKTKR